MLDTKFNFSESGQLDSSVLSGRKPKGQFSGLRVNVFKGHSCNCYVYIYSCYICPLLESSSQVPHTEGEQWNIDKIENVQYHFTKRLPGMWYVPYCTRLELVKLDSLETRRIHSDLLFFYKLNFGKTSIDITSYRFTHSYRGHSKTLFLHFSAKDKRKYFWINRIVPYWNSLPNEIVNCNSLLAFKCKMRM